MALSVISSFQLNPHLLTSFPFFYISRHLFLLPFSNMHFPFSLWFYSNSQSFYILQYSIFPCFQTFNSLLFLMLPLSTFRCALFLLITTSSQAFLFFLNMFSLCLLLLLSMILHPNLSSVILFTMHLLHYSSSSILFNLLSVSEVSYSLSPI